MNNSVNITPAKKAKVIADYGVNTAYLEPGETCVSYKHGLCALIVVSNGEETFVTHQARPNLENLFRELKKVRVAMDGPLHVQLFQTDIGTPQDRITRQYLQDLTFGLNLIFPLPHTTEKSAGNYGSYLINAKGSVHGLGLENNPAYQQTCATYRQDFQKDHSQQRIIASQTQRDSEGISVFNYGEIPTPLIVKEISENSLHLPKHFITTENLGASVERWNNKVMMANYDHEKAFPQGVLEEDRLRMDQAEDDAHRRDSYHAYSTPRTMIGGPKSYSGPSQPEPPCSSLTK